MLYIEETFIYLYIYVLFFVSILKNKKKGTEIRFLDFIIQICFPSKDKRK